MEKMKNITLILSTDNNKYYRVAYTNKHGVVVASSAYTVKELLEKIPAIIKEESEGAN